MQYYTMVIQDARGGNYTPDVHVYLNDPIWGANTFKANANYWTGAMFGTYQYYLNTKSIVFTSTSHPGLLRPGEEINEEPYIWMRWDFISYPDHCKPGAGKSGEGEVWTNFNPDQANPIRWATG